MKGLCKRNFSRGSAILLLVVTWPFLTGMGEKYQSERNALGKRVAEVLIANGYCAEFNDCRKKNCLFVDGDTRVSLNMYGITDGKLLAAVVGVVVAEGPEITRGAPISLKIYPKPKKEYLGLKAFLSEPFIQLEIE